MADQIVGFKMNLFPGKTDEYKNRHDKIWPELSLLLTQAGISDYSIFLDEETNILFGTFKAAKENTIDDLPHHPLMKKWWDYMADIMETEPTNEPISKPLQNMFYMK